MVGYYKNTSVGVPLINLFATRPTKDQHDRQILVLQLLDSLVLQFIFI